MQIADVVPACNSNCAVYTSRFATLACLPDGKSFFRIFSTRCQMPLMAGLGLMVYTRYEHSNTHK
eukprot:IDg5555t1